MSDYSRDKIKKIVRRYWLITFKEVISILAGASFASEGRYEYKNKHKLYLRKNKNNIGLETSRIYHFTSSASFERGWVMFAFGVVACKFCHFRSRRN